MWCREHPLPSLQSLIGTIRGLFNYIWADNKDPGQINGRKAAGFLTRLVTPMGSTAQRSSQHCDFPCNNLRREEALPMVQAGCVSTDLSPNSAHGPARGVLSTKWWPLWAWGNSAFLDIVKLFYLSRTRLHKWHTQRSALTEVNIHQIILALAKENWLMLSWQRKTWYLQ